MSLKQTDAELTASEELKKRAEMIRDQLNIVAIEEYEDTSKLSSKELCDLCSEFDGLVLSDRKF